MGSQIATRTVQLTPHIVTAVAILVALVLSTYWVRTGRSGTVQRPTRSSADPEHFLLLGLLLIAIVLIVGLLALLALSSNVFVAVDCLRLPRGHGILLQQDRSLAYISRCMNIGGRIVFPG
jgi:preprotein translocase subunit Sec61beta